MATMKRCKQCGILKESEEFRQYTYAKEKETAGRYCTCKACENINQKYKRALFTVENSKVDDTEEQYEEFKRAREVVMKTEMLYEVLRMRGLHVAVGAKKEAKVSIDAVDAMLAFYVEPEKPKVLTAIPVPLSIPDDLAEWLKGSFEEWMEAGLSPEYLQETVYESLKAKYRPQTGFDTTRGLPIYDDTYKATLNDILRNFDDYEDAMSKEG